MVVRENDQTFRICDSYAYQAREGERLLVNDGSVGQPRDRNPQAGFCIYDSETALVEILRVDYPVKVTQDKMRELGFADFLIHRLEEGR